MAEKPGIYTFILEWDNAALYKWSEPEYWYDGLECGSWFAPYPNEKGNSQVYGLLETWGQSDRAIMMVIAEHGEPTRVSIW